MKFTALTLGLALALGTASAAQAGESEDYAGGDGIKKPKKKDDGMRGVASSLGLASARLQAISVSSGLLDGAPNRFE